MEKGSGRRKRTSPTTPPTPTSPTTEADEQQQEMEKFYALVGSIRAMRDLIRTDESKRQKMAAPPLWRPTFKLEDFKGGEKPGTVADTASSALKEEQKKR
ncbi:hypothetical protein GW17_00047874 [Ensete ventricosum]|uniref:Uncharacterized protein n=1 Tax=Ensete ventricosum TaxID=4639 RepID=A0A426YNW2_ENSVE|nr:hypothetical protein B296_00033567 [Ensete ventricosum]RWV89956.1 hypothetical protein GW17_00047874 [Ensete ventricosum]